MRRVWNQKCTCGEEFEVVYTYEVDNWNTGHYGQSSGVICCEKYCGHCENCGKTYEDVKEELEKLNEKLDKKRKKLRITLEITGTFENLEAVKDSLEYNNCVYKVVKREKEI